MGTYATNPQVIHETIDGETIIIDLVSGTYYSLQGTGPEIWNRLAGGQSATRIVDGLAPGHAGDRAEVEAAVAAFLRELESEQLIAPAESNGNGMAAEADGAEAAGPFAPPKLEKYTDMQDIILLDPVHKVDDRGWPHAAQPQAS
jgi:hypothetical protein